MKLPGAFTDKMRKLMGEDEYGELEEALNGQRQYGLRVNTLKADRERFIKASPFQLAPVPWTTDGFYISAEDAPGRHPYYHAGVYYIQEPSAMLPGQILGAQPGEKVLDLCAAPGGKTVQIAAAMKGRGLLVSNDISAERVKALVKNIELCGVRNAVVLNETPEKLVRNFPGYFDRIIIDAPCSGEGMFRKDEAAVKSWESFKCERCTQLQEPILENAHLMLKPGGTLVYSTCTFSPEEDEQMIARFMERHGEYDMEEIPKIAGMEGGRPQWADGGRDFERAARLWPHRVRGEGHFVVKLVKKHITEVPEERAEFASAYLNEGIFDGSGAGKGTAGMTGAVGALEAATSYERLPESFKQFVRENLNSFPEGVFLQKGHHLYQLPEPPPGLDGLKVAKFGWFLGTFEDNRFEPSHSMVTALDIGAFKRILDLDASDRNTSGYLKGETLMTEGEKGLTAVCVNGWTLGWAKQTGDMLKNMYPKGWRRLS